MNCGAMRAAGTGARWNSQVHREPCTVVYCQLSCRDKKKSALAQALPASPWQLTKRSHHALVELSAMVRVVRASQMEIETAVQALRDGDLVSFPTETVYGLGANAQSPTAVRKIFEAKGRPMTHPVIVHLDSARFLHRWVREVPDAAARLAERFWPGPLTMVLPRAHNVHDILTGGQDTVAVRVPSHTMAQQLLTAFGGGIAAPSANRYGRLSPTRAEHVREEFGTEVRVVLDGGDCRLGLESTIVACLDGKVQLLRPGSITLSQLERVVGEVVTETSAQSPRVPGSSGAHYAPNTPLSVVSSGELEGLVAA